MSAFRDVPDRLSFPGKEEDILKFWEEIDAFQTSLKQSLEEGRPEYTFYDGPPFATGLPHYGHILAGTIKDIVTRYAHQTGHHVTRRFGWDTHGLPVEFEIDKKLNINSKQDVLDYGIDNYNKECRSIVMRYSSEWETIVKRLGRWIDFDNDYKTLEPWYMESVWWVFKTIFDKGLVYQGYRVMPYSTACTTPLSNFEANLNYKDVKDPAVVVSFPLRDEPDVSLVAWTTTPWTLPSNLALCVNAAMDYVKIKDVKTGKLYIIAETRLVELYPKMKKKGYKGGEHEVLAKYKGSDLKGKSYEPLFGYYKDHPNAFQVLTDDYVKEDGGTGIVHQSPAFGEDDYRVCMEHGVITKGGVVPCPVDENGCFDQDVTDFAGKYVKDADKDICQHLKDLGRLVSKGQIDHSYPFCWRSDTPLIYKIVPSWFVKVESIKEKLIANNLKTYWVPSAVKEKRFHNWLKDARDWNVSRNRYWGTPLPVWVSEDGEEVVVVGSIDELEQLSGVRVDDLHRESIDDIVIPSRQGKGDLKRVEEVFDCWFESGSMPYAQQHYPFENKERFEANFPADFIAEGLDQTRGWFYTLMVLSTALFDKPAFKNLIVNGLVLAEDGKKMSKSKKNYPDPMIVVNEYGSDALRLYLINSPVVHADPFAFKKDGVLSVLKVVFLPWYNAFRFFVQNALRQEMKSGQPFNRESAEEDASSSTNVMDKWILAALHRLIQFVHQEMDGYRLYTVVPALLSFIEELTNWYVRLNRPRLKGAAGDDDTRKALATLYVVLLNLTKLMAPFTPFFTEYLYQELVQPDPKSRYGSVHFHGIPEFNPSLLDDEIQAKMARLQTAITLGRLCRERRNISLKKPVKAVHIVHRDQAVLDGLKELGDYLNSELNTKEIIFSTDEKTWCTMKAKPNMELLGKRLGKEFGKVRGAIFKMTPEQLEQFEIDGKVELAGHEITTEEIILMRNFKGDTKLYEASVSPAGDLTLIVDVTVDDSLVLEGIAREVLNRVQKLRKASGLQIADKVEVFYESLAKLQHDPFQGESKKDLQNVNENAERITKAVNQCNELITGTLGMKVHPISKMPKYALRVGDQEDTVGGATLRVVITKPAVSYAPVDQMKTKFEMDDDLLDTLQVAVASLNFPVVEASFKNNTKLVVKLDGKSYELEPNVDIFMSVA